MANGWTEAAATNTEGSSLIRELKNPDARVRLAAVLALRKLGAAAEDALPALLNALEDPDAGVVEAAAETLGRRGAVTKDLVHGLMKALKDPDAYQLSVAGGEDSGGKERTGFH